MTQKQWERQWPPVLPYDYSGMTLDKALKMIEGVKKKAQEMGFAETVAVCDAAGNLVALERMDDCTLLSLEIAVNKARTAVLGKIPTHQWGAFFKGAEPILAPLWFHTGWITFMGGFPIIVEGKLIGGLGCSGATWEDGVMARAGLKALCADLSGVEACLKDHGVTPEKW
jgi:uncharacterized protein GlcG (DUF336 family)